MTRIHTHIVVFIMAAVVLVTSLCAPVLSVDAAGKRDSLYGTGSANELDIVKLLDLALNRGGMSMSPETIKEFLEYWWDSVVADLNTCLNDVDTSITTTAALVDYINTALVGAEHYDQLGDIIKRYVKFVATMDYKTLADFKQLLTQEGTFREFLLSYVTDEDGNIVDTVDNKIKKYNIGKTCVDMVRKAADAYIKEYEGYYLVPTFTYRDFPASGFKTKEEYDFVIGSLKTIPADALFFYSRDKYNHYFSLGTDYFFVSNMKQVSFFNNVYIYDSSWNRTSYYTSLYPLDTDFACDLSEFNSTQKLGSSAAFCFDMSQFLSSSYVYTWFFPVTSDGRLIKVWKSLDAYKNYSVGKSRIYYSSKYSGFDDTADNSVTFTGDYYMNSNYSHTTIQQNIDNSQEINETVINNIVNNYITNNYYDTDGSGGGSGGGSGSSGNWFTDLIGGIPQLLKALIDGLTGILESAANLIEKLVGIITDLFVPSEGVFDSVTTKVNEKFTFKDQSETNMRLIFDELPNMGQTAPTITFPLSETSLARYGVEDVTVSFEWYAKYKPTVDVIFSAILWAMFAFNQYFAIKNIINASGNALDIPADL